MYFGKYLLHHRAAVMWWTVTPPSAALQDVSGGCWCQTMSATMRAVCHLQSSQSNGGLWQLLTNLSSPIETIRLMNRDNALGRGFCPSRWRVSFLHYGYYLALRSYPSWPRKFSATVRESYPDNVLHNDGVV